MTQLRRSIGLFDATMINVGTIIGSGAFMAAAEVAQRLSSVPLNLFVWLLAAVISLLGALTISELGAAFPRAGGMFVYLEEVYGPLWSFFYGWAECAVILAAGNAAVAVLCAAYIGHFVPLTELQIEWVAVACIAALTLVNVLGVRQGVAAQNLTTLLKMGMIVVLATMAFAAPGQRGAAGPEWIRSLGPFSLSALTAALIQPLWAFDGWIYACCMGSEMKKPVRDLPLATIGSIGIVAALYLLLNAGYLHALGVDGVARSNLVAAATASAVAGAPGAAFASVLVIVSVLGSLNGGMLTGPRVLFAMAQDGVFFPIAGRVHPRFRTPAVALLLLGGWSAALVFTGRYHQLLTYALFASWLFYGMAAAGVIVLRFRRPEMERPYRVWGYPWVPLVFALFTIAFLFHTLYTDPRDALIGLGLAASGLPIYLYARHKKRRSVLTR